jgi:MoxR-like ATPase
LLGAPGIGKSSIVRQAAETIADVLGLKFVEYDDFAEIPENAFVFIDIRLSEVEPSDLIGIPRTDSDYVMYKPLKWALTLAKHPGIVFLDELTNVQDDTVLAASYKILLDRRVGFVKLHSGVMVVAAGNTPETSVIARELPAPQINRTLVIDTDTPSLNEWFGYMEKRISNVGLTTAEEIEKYKEIAKVVEDWKKKKELGKLYTLMASYLVARKTLFTKPMATAMQNFATPRTWEMLYWTLTDEFDKIYSDEEIKAICIGFLGKQIGMEFYSWLKRPLPRIDDVLNNPAMLDRLEIDDLIVFTALFGHYVRTEIQSIIKSDELQTKVDNVIKKIVDRSSRELLIVFAAMLGTEKAEARLNLIKLASKLPNLRKLIVEMGKAVE